MAKVKDAFTSGTLTEQAFGDWQNAVITKQNGDFDEMFQVLTSSSLDTTILNNWFQNFIQIIYLSIYLKINMFSIDYICLKCTNYLHFE